ncbi:MAG TPA: hypothetical protein VGD76_03620, partial [Ramlibacter sp.]
MDEIVYHPLAQAGAARPPAPRKASLHTWFAEGVRAGFFLRPRVSGHAAPWHVAAALVLFSALEIGLARLEIPGAADFNLRGWLGSWWSPAAVLLLAWSLLWGQAAGEAKGRPAGAASWFLLWLMASLP